MLDSGQSHRRCRGDDIDLEPGHLVLVGCEERLERLVEDLVGGVDGDEAGYLSGIGAGIVPTEHATERVADQDVGPGTCAAPNNACRSPTIWATERGSGTGSLRLGRPDGKTVPGRS